jgi:hypothetical protein
MADEDVGKLFSPEGNLRYARTRGGYINRVSQRRGKSPLFPRAASAARQ